MIEDSDPIEEDETGRGGLLPDSLRKALVTGVSAVLMTEEGIRNALGDLRMPKEAIGYVVQQTEKSRRELFQAVSGEVKGFLKNVDVPGALRKAMTGMKLEVKAEVRFVDQTKTESEVTSKVSDLDDEDSRATGKSKTAAKRKKKRTKRKSE